LAQIFDNYDLFPPFAPLLAKHRETFKKEMEVKDEPVPNRDFLWSVYPKAKDPVNLSALSSDEREAVSAISPAGQRIAVALVKIGFTKDPELWNSKEALELLPHEVPYVYYAASRETTAQELFALISKLNPTLTPNTNRKKLIDVLSAFFSLGILEKTKEIIRCKK
jgi:hypothetical protein